MARRKDNLKHRYGITIEEYEQMEKEQKGVCKICKKKPEGHLHVDHSHKTKKVRGLLCGCCNRGIGLLKEDPQIFLNSLEYLGAA